MRYLKGLAWQQASDDTGARANAALLNRSSELRIGENNWNFVRLTSCQAMRPEPVIRVTLLASTHAALRLEKHFIYI